MPKRAAGKLLLLLLTLLLLPAAGPALADGWQTVAPGLELGRFKAHLQAKLGDSTLTVLRVNPGLWRFRLLAASQYDKRPHTVEAWAQKMKLTAVANAGMHRKDLLTATGYLKNFHHLNNRRLTPDYHSVLAFNPTTSAAPDVKLYDLKCEPFFGFQKHYETLVQGIRMLSCLGENRWTPRERKFSIASLAQDAKGNVLFIISRSPYRARDFVDIVTRLPLGAQRMMYLEGGAQASLFVAAGGQTIRAMGMPPEGPVGDKGRKFQDVPNVLGIVKR